MYFLVPTTTNLPDGPIRLGQVIRNPRQPTERMLHPSRDSDLVAPASVTKTFQSVQDFLTSANSSSAHSAGANALDIVRAGLRSSSRNDMSYAIDGAVIETHEFDPRSDLLVPDGAPGGERTFTEQLRDNMQHALGLNGPKWWPFRSRVYVVTGVKIVRQPGAVSAEFVRARGWGVEGAAPLDPTGTVPLSAEVATERDVESHSYVRGTPMNDFVCAYRLREMHYTRRGEGRVKYSVTVKGGEILRPKMGHEWSDEDSSSEEDEDEQEDMDEDRPWELETMWPHFNDFGQERVEEDAERVVPMRDGGGQKYGLVI